MGLTPLEASRRRRLLRKRGPLTGLHRPRHIEYHGSSSFEALMTIILTGSAAKIAFIRAKVEAIWLIKTIRCDCCEAVFKLDKEDIFWIQRRYVLDWSAGDRPILGEDSVVSCPCCYSAIKLTSQIPGIDEGGAEKADDGGNKSDEKKDGNDDFRSEENWNNEGGR